HMNVLDCRITEEGGQTCLAGEGFRIAVDAAWLRGTPASQKQDAAVRLGIRPEFIAIAAPGERADRPAVGGTLVTVETMGHENAFAVDLGGVEIRARAPAYETRHIL